MPAAVVSEVEHEPSHSTVGEPCDRSAELPWRRFPESAQPDVRDSGPEVDRAYGLDGVDLSLDLDLSGFRPAFPRHSEADSAAWRAPQETNHLRKRQSVCRVPVDPEDAVARAQAGSLCRRAFDRRYHGGRLLPFRHFEADARPTWHRLGQFLICLGVEVLTVSIERH